MSQLMHMVGKRIARTYGVMVSTLDFESNNPSSILGMSFFYHKDAIKSD